MLEIGPFGSMGGDGRRTIGTASRHRADPRLYCEGFQTPAVTNIPTRTAAGV
jgi:hypothetical protein